MKGFWRLYTKELRFLAVPGIGMIVFDTIRTLLVRLLHFLTPSFYTQNILMRPDNPRFLAKYIVRPVLLLPDQAHSAIYALLLLYALIHEHTSKTKYQVAMMPVNRSFDIGAKFSAIMTWAFIAIPMAFIVRSVFDFFSQWLPPLQQTGGASLEVIVIGVSSMIFSILLLSSLVTLGYVTAMVANKHRYIIGIATIIIGYVCSEYITIIVNHYMSQHHPFQHGIPILSQLFVWGDIISQAIAMFLFLFSAIFLYNRYSEI